MTNDDFTLRKLLGYRMLRWVFSIALVAGASLSAMQVAVDARQVSAELDQHALQTLSLVQDAATQAIFSLDEGLADQVVAGLFRQREVQQALISHTNGNVLAGRERPMQEAGYRGLTDLMFGSSRSYTVDLQRRVAFSSNPAVPNPPTYGQLRLTYDTAPAAAAWMERSALTFAFGIARALVVCLVLYLVIQWLLTRPLQRIVRALAKVDPEHPGQHPLRRIAGHDGDELDLWIGATNQLLAAIEESQSKHKAAEERANHLGRFDQLTGLPRRETILSTLNAYLKDCDQRQANLAVYCCGLDDFKSINEQLGYGVGDQVLKTIAQRLQDQPHTRHVLVGRLNSDQFVVIVWPVEDQYEAAELAERLLNLFSEPVEVDDIRLQITTTIGVALFPTDTRQADHLLLHAEHTMTLAKAKGYNHARFYVASIDREIRSRKLLEKDLAHALQNHEFHLVYQPQISLQSKRVIGVEALIRWNHPERGLVPPDQFIPLAELNGTIVDIGQWVLDEACRQAARWAADGMPLRVAVNLSAVQLRQPDIVGAVLATLSRHQIPPGRLELEITETGFMENLDDAVDKLQQLNKAGINIAVDDFGTGYSSLTYLKKMPIQHLKIDKQFVTDLLLNEDDTHIANTIIDLGRSLNMFVIAEGVETQEQEFYLRQRGCQVAQGYHFSRPLLPEAVTGFVADFHGKLEENMENNEDNH